jgi:hypothetical protein
MRAAFVAQAPSAQLNASASIRYGLIIVAASVVVGA